MEPRRAAKLTHPGRGAAAAKALMGRELSSPRVAVSLLAYIPGLILERAESGGAGWGIGSTIRAANGQDIGLVIGVKTEFVRQDVP